MSAGDLTETLRDAVAAALREHQPLRIAGGGSKAFYGRSCAAPALDVTGHRGIVHYQPTELVITARAGTPLAELEAALAEQRQMLAFEPPHFAAGATLGGTIACGFSGPRRPFAGAARDFVLGCKMLNGKAEVLQFGGEAIKNVAGYDVPRLLAGSLGTLGILLDVSLKVLPMPDSERTLRFDIDMARALQTMRDWQQQCLPLSALCYADGGLYVRLSGGERAVAAAAGKLGGELLEEGTQFWRELREQRRAFFNRPGSLWRVSLPPATPHLEIGGAWLYDWGGALRWLKSSEPAAHIFAAAQQHRGHATLFRGGDRNGAIFQPLPEALLQLNRRVKQAFDPQGIFNPGCIYATI